MPSFPSRFLLTSLLTAMLWLCSAGHSLFAQQQQFGPSPVDPLVFETDSPRYTDCVDVAAWDCPTCDDWVWTFLPKGFLYTTYWAGAAEPRLGVQVLHEKDDGAYVDSWIGGRVGFVRFGSRESLEGWQLDLLAGVRLRQDPDEELDMQSTDYRFDIPLTYRQGPHAWKVGYYHVSSHLGDEFLLKNPAYPRLNFLRDVIVLGYSYYPWPELRLYAEAGWGFHTDVSEPWEFQFGFDYGPAWPTRIYGAPFVAANVHLRQELNFGGNFMIEGGWAWRGEGLGAGILRTGPYYYTGGSSQSSYYADSEQQIGVGLWYDF